MENFKGKLQERASPSLNVFCMGPGVGESIVLQLPCGSWGVVDGYNRSSGALEFLRLQGVERLKFFCLTHPHEDHYFGAHKLLRHYSGKIEAIWRFPGFSSKDLFNLALAAKVAAEFHGDPEAEELSNDYLEVLKQIVVERDIIVERDRKKATGNYRQIIAPTRLVEDRLYTVDAIGPAALSVDQFVEHFSRILVRNGELLLNEEGGELINSLSVVLQIRFGKANVFLLADAQGPEDPLDTSIQRHCLVKVAHHGSDNGLSAAILTKRGKADIDHLMITPYSRSGLPTEEMSSRYKGCCKALLFTGSEGYVPPQKMVPGLMNARMASKTVRWVGARITRDGKVANLSQA